MTRPTAAGLQTLFRQVIFAAPPVSMPVRVLRFLATGTAGLVTDVGVYTAVFLAFPSAAFCRVVSLVTATYVTWQLNRHATFGASAGAAYYELLRYGMTALAAQGFNFGLFLLLRRLEPHIADQALIALCGALAALFSFVGQNLFTFRPARRSAAVSTHRAHPHQ
jgi:putative flippase GtrA